MKSFRQVINRMQLPLRGQHAGFTLIELAVAIAISAFLLGCTTKIFLTLSKSYTKEITVTQVQQNANICLNFMARNLQNAGLDPLGVTSATILTAGTHSIQFTADLDMDGSIGGSVGSELEDITYTYDNTTRLISIIDGFGTAELIRDVTDCTFTYFGLASTSLDTIPIDVSEIRSVDINITVSKPAGRAGFVSRSLNTRVNCRNLGDQRG